MIASPCIFTEIYADPDLKKKKVVSEDSLDIDNKIS